MREDARHKPRHLQLKVLCHSAWAAAGALQLQDQSLKVVAWFEVATIVRPSNGTAFTLLQRIRLNDLHVGLDEAGWARAMILTMILNGMLGSSQACWFCKWRSCLNGPGPVQLSELLRPLDRVRIGTSTVLYLRILTGTKVTEHQPLQPGTPLRPTAHCSRFLQLSYAFCVFCSFLMHSLMLLCAVLLECYRRLRCDI